MIQTIQAEERTKLSRSGLRQLRQKGRIPSVVYGKHVDNVMIHISSKDFHQWAKQGVTGVVELDIAGNNKLPVMLGDLQYDPITRELVHIDFQHVRMDEAVRSRIPLEFVGTSEGVKEGGVLNVQDTSIEVECLPKDLPATIEVDVSGLAIGDSISAGEISLPNEVTLITDSEEVLVSVVAPTVEQTEEAEAADEETSEDSE